LSFHDRIVRQARLRNPASWMSALQRADGSHLSEDRVLEWSALGFEFMLNALRLRDGVPRHYFTERTGLALQVLEPAVARATQRGLLEADPARFRASAL